MPAEEEKKNRVTVYPPAHISAVKLYETLKTNRQTPYMIYVCQMDTSKFVVCDWCMQI